MFFKEMFFQLAKQYPYDPLGHVYSMDDLHIRDNFTVLFWDWMWAGSLLLLYWEYGLETVSAHIEIVHMGTFNFT